MAAIAVLHAWPTPGHDFALSSSTVQRLDLLARSAPAPRPRLALCWTTDRTGRPVAHWDVEPPD